MGCSCHRKGSGRAKGRARAGLCGVKLDSAVIAGGRGREKQRRWRSVGLGTSLPSMGTSNTIAPPSSGEGKAGSEATDTVLHHSSLSTHTHSPILPCCGILGLWNKSIIGKAIPSSVAVMVIPRCCFNIPLAYVRLPGHGVHCHPQTQVVRMYQKLQVKVPSDVEERKGYLGMSASFTLHRAKQWCTRVKGSFLKSLGSACHKTVLRGISDCKEELDYSSLKAKKVQGFHTT